MSGDYTFNYDSYDCYKVSCIESTTILLLLTLYDPAGGGGFKSSPPPNFCSHAFNFGATLLCVGDFSQKIV